MTVKEASDKWGVSNALVYKWITDKRIHFDIIGGHVDIPEDTERPSPKRPGRKVNSNGQ
jgi:excisionase family DNA binding protein